MHLINRINKQISVVFCYSSVMACSSFFGGESGYQDIAWNFFLPNAFVPIMVINTIDLYCLMPVLVALTWVKVICFCWYSVLFFFSFSFCSPSCGKDPYRTSAAVHISV